MFLQRLSLLVVGTAFALGATAFGATAPEIPARVLPAPVASAGLSFDEIDETDLGGTSTPLTGNFARDVAAIRASSHDVPEAPETSTGLGLGAITAMSRHASAPRLRHFSFLGSFVRVDDPVAGRAIIADTEISRIVSLDLAHKTYRLVDDAAAGGWLSMVSTVLSGLQSGPPTQAGVQTLAPKEFDGIRAPGYSVSTAIDSVASDTCPMAIHAQQFETYYVDPGHAEPALAGEALSLATVDLLAIHGTQPEIRSSPLPLPSDFTKNLASQMQCFRGSRNLANENNPSLRLYREVDSETTITMPALNMTTTVKAHGMMERANVATLDAGSAALFAVPPGFTREP